MNITRLERRLAIQVSLGMFLFAILAGTFTYVFLFRHEQLEVDTLQQQLIRTVLSQAEVGIYARNEPIAQDIAEGLLGNTIFLAVRIASFDDFQYEARSIPSLTPVWTISYPLYSPVNRQEKIGVLQVMQNREKIDREAKVLAIHGVLLMYLQSLIAAVLVVVVSRRLLSRPVILLVARLKEILPGGGVRLPPDPDHPADEIAQLQESINRLLEASDDALRQERLLRGHLGETVEAFERQKVFLETVLDNIQDGIVACDETGRLFLFNRATHLMHGLEIKPLPAEEWAGHYHIFRADGVTPMPKEEVPLFQAFMGQEVHNQELVIIPRPHVQLLLQANGRPMYDARGNRLGAVVSLHDITAQRQAEKEILKLNQLLTQRVNQQEGELRLATAEVRGLAERLDNAEEAEKRKIAVEIHDELGSLLTTLKLKIKLLAQGIDAASLQETDQLIDQAFATVRHIAVSLRPPLLDKFGVQAALSWLAENTRRHSGLDCQLEEGGEEIHLNEKDRTAIYRICQEALTNAVRHAGASAVRIRLYRERGQVVLTVEDNGRGFDPEKLSPHALFGLESMRERALRRHGRLTVEKRSGGGTRIVTVLPMDEPPTVSGQVTGLE
ncbi:MAG: ATP-binding protein [Magnetococcales bacterium]|nr:ATP-binding protein [Magnetococcales bacterium]